MKCYLHIGTSKTGTTTIQHFLLENRKALLAQGYYLLDSLRLPDNRNLALAVANSNHRDGYTQRLAIFTDKELIAKQQEIICALKEEVRQLPPNAQAICSGEHIQSRLKTQEEVTSLKQLLVKIGFTKIVVIVYLRNPAEIANSLYTMTIKGGNTATSVPTPSRPNYENICNHRKTLEKFGSAFGAENLIVRLFRKDKFKDSSLLVDFSHQLGIGKHLASMHIPPNRNESLSILGLKLLRSLNEKIPKFNETGLNLERIGLEELISKHFSHPKFVMSEALYGIYNSHFKASNEWVREHYFPEENELFPLKTPKPSQLSIPENEIEVLSTAISQLWLSDKQSFSYRPQVKKKHLEKLKQLSQGLVNDLMERNHTTLKSRLKSFFNI